MTKQRRAATSAEAKAMAHPLRLRILRLCLDEPRTNKELADRLDMAPATVLHHVRTLVETGFLSPAEVRTGAGGALEKPYVATRKSWDLDTEGMPEDDALGLAMVHAFRDEVLEAGPGALRNLARLGLRLNQQSEAELRARLWDVIEDFGARPPDVDGEPLALFVAMHVRP
ncbi:MAG: helix-turn-helix domain-containing protein [Actinomycetota bacterium]